MAFIAQIHFPSLERTEHIAIQWLGRLKGSQQNRRHCLSANLSPLTWHLLACPPHINFPDNISNVRAEEEGGIGQRRRN
jgi:hypothetical protein